MSIPGEIFDEHLILSRIADGDEEAFAVLFKKFGNNLYSQALAYTKSSEVAQDIVQDVFLKVWEKRKSLGNIVQVDNYLFIMARNRIITVMRKKLTLPVSNNMQDLITENSPSAEQQITIKQAEQILENGIANLPVQRQRIFRMSRKDGMSHQEIANELNISPSTVKGHIILALNYLRSYMRTHGDPIIGIILLFFFSQGKS